MMEPETENTFKAYETIPYFQFYNRAENRAWDFVW